MPLTQRLHASGDGLIRERGCTLQTWAQCFVPFDGKNWHSCGSNSIQLQAGTAPCNISQSYGIFILDRTFCSAVQRCACKQVAKRISRASRPHYAPTNLNKTLRIQKCSGSMSRLSHNGECLWPCTCMSADCGAVAPLSRHACRICHHLSECFHWWIYQAYQASLPDQPCDVQKGWLCLDNCFGDDNDVLHSA